MRPRALFQHAALAANRRLGKVFPRSLRRGVREWLFPPVSPAPVLEAAAPPPPPDTRKRMELIIDVVGSCNLRCPSCPVGSLGPLNPTGLIDKQLFSRVVAKAAREYRIFQVSLYNWAEPFLHPDLPELIRVVKRHDLHCGLSSNLNLLRDNIDMILLAQPDEIRISLSGFTQEVYGQTHAAGNIERVKANMKKLAESRERTGNTATRIHVYFHKYRHNLHEVEPMRAYARSLGFDWLEHWAYYMPFENVADLAEGRLAAEKRAFVDRQFALPIAEAVEAAEQFKDRPCRLYDEQLVIDLQGNLLLCCTVYDFEKNRLGSFLDMTPDDVARAKENHATCHRCAGHGIHMYMTYHDYPDLRAVYDYLVKKNLRQNGLLGGPRPELVPLGIRKVA